MIRLIFLLVVFFSFTSTLSIAADTPLPSFDINASDKVACDPLPGLADSYVLALNLQPGFCESDGYQMGKPECLHLKKNSFYWYHLSLHGLWPNQRRCGTGYNFCASNPKKHHCDYPEIVVSQAVSMKLKQYMPSYFYGSCLDRHEWNKHGSCQMLSANDYFALALRLTQSVDQSSFAHYLRDHLGQVVTRSAIKSAWTKAYGLQANQKMFLSCKNGVLTDIFIQLPALIPFYAPIEDLIDAAESTRRKDRCPTYVKISAFGALSNDLTVHS